MYSMKDYKAALAEREEKDFGSQSWNYAQAKVQAIAAILVATGNEEMVAEIVEELYSMNDSGFIRQCSMIYGFWKEMDTKRKGKNLLSLAGRYYFFTHTARKCENCKRKKSHLQKGV